MPRLRNFDKRGASATSIMSESPEHQTQQPHDARRKLRWTLGGALVGAVIGTPSLGGMMYSFGRLFSFEPSLPVVYGVAFCLATAIGAVFSRRWVARQIRQTQTMHQAAGDLNLDFGGDEEAALETRLRDLFFHHWGVELSNAMHRRSGSTRLCIGSLQLRPTIDDKPHPRWRRTAAYFESEKLSLPNFTLSPETGTSRVLHALMGAEAADIDFDEHPAFSERYHLGAVQREWTRKLFGKRLRNFLARHPGLELHAEENRLVVLYPQEITDARKVKRFAKLAVRLFRLLHKSSRRVRPTETERRPDAHAAADRWTGAFGTLMQGTLIAPADMDAVLSQPPPRTLPDNIRRRWLSCASLLVLFVGGWFALGGLFFFVVGGFLAAVNQPTDRIWFRVGGLVFVFVGLLLAAVPWLWYRHKLRLLRMGRVSEAVVDNVERSSVEVSGFHGKGRRYRASFHYNLDGTTHTAVCNVCGEAARKAIRLAEKKTPTHIVYDPNRPSRVFWPQTLVSARPGYA